MATSEPKKKLTDSAARGFPRPTSGYVLHWCGATPGFGLRVTAKDARSWIFEARRDGKTVRRTLAKATGRGAVSADAARKLCTIVSGELATGKDRLTERKAQRAEEKADRLTFGAALREYVAKKRRADDKALKERTKADYLAMIAPAGSTKAGRPTLPGSLQALADRPLHRISGDELRKLHADLQARGKRQQAYAMQVARAVIRFHGVTVPDNPFSAATAERDRIKTPKSSGRPRPIPEDRLRAWWAAASAIDSTTADQLRFRLLTGCRPGETAKIAVKDVDMRVGAITLPDTKNRRDHVVYLSTHAKAIVAKHLRRGARARAADAPLFDVGDVRKTLATINAAAGVGSEITPHKLRHTFASVADHLVTGYTLKRMLNHEVSGSDDVTSGYVGIADERLRDAWQRVGDYIVGAKT